MKQQYVENKKNRLGPSTERPKINWILEQMRLAGAGYVTYGDVQQILYWSREWDTD